MHWSRNPSIRQELQAIAMVTCARDFMGTTYISLPRGA